MCAHKCDSISIDNIPLTSDNRSLSDVLIIPQLLVINSKLFVWNKRN